MKKEIKVNDTIINKKNTNWGKWKVLKSDIAGMFEIVAENGQGTRMLDVAEKDFWAIV